MKKQFFELVSNIKSLDNKKVESIIVVLKIK